MEPKRLQDRILSAMELALDQGDLETADHLRLALERVMTRFGGPGATEQRAVPEEVLAALDRFHAMRAGG